MDNKQESFHPTQFHMPNSSLVGIFSQHLQSDPQRVCCYAVKTKGEELVATPMTYTELAGQSLRAARIFQEYGAKPGDRIVISLEDPHGFLACFMGALSAGLIAVPVPTVGKLMTPGVFLDRIKGICKDCLPRLVVVENRQRWQGAMQGLQLDHPVIEISQINAEVLDQPSSFLFKDQPLNQIAFLQYTSGSTGNPKGVIITHGNLVAQWEAIGLATKFTQNDIMLSWLPFHHDMGIMALIIPLYWKIPTYVLSPLTFITMPVIWVRAISRFRATLSVSPTFACSICYRRLSERDLQEMDISSWRVNYVGAEPINPQTARGFTGRFAQYGFAPTTFYPVYGLAETTLAAAFPPLGEKPVYDAVDRMILAREGRAVPVESSSPGSVEFISVGTALPGHQLRILDPKTSLECGERQVGEIVLSGPSVSPGYFGDNLDQPRKELHTGDLGYQADGRLYVIDRLKDLVIIAGQNYAPSDIEECVAKTPGLRRGRIVAFSIVNKEGTESLYIVAEIDARTWRSSRAIQEEVVSRVRRHFALSVERVFLTVPGTLEKTTSGKIRRGVCKRSFIEGTLPCAQGIKHRLSIKVRSLLTRFLKLVVKS